MEQCPCQSGLAFADCCGPILDGSAHAKTAEALMRARYSSYVLERVAFVGQSNHPDTRDDFDEEASKRWSESVTWQGLEILHTEGGGEGDDEGVVEFVARFDDAKGQPAAHRERSTFKRHEGRWYFYDGKLLERKPFVRSVAKVGRNEPCPCKSGKKYKKCCGSVRAA